MFSSLIVTALFDFLWVNIMLTRCSLILSSKDNFLRGDGNRRVQHQQQQQRKPRKKTKPPALTKKHKKKRRRGPRRPQKPIPPALPQGNLGMPSTSLAMPSQASIRSATPVSLHCWVKNLVCSRSSVREILSCHSCFCKRFLSHLFYLTLALQLQTWVQRSFLTISPMKWQTFQMTLS